MWKTLGFSIKADMTFAVPTIPPLIWLTVPHNVAQPQLEPVTGGKNQAKEQK